MTKWILVMSPLRLKILTVQGCGVVDLNVAMLGIP